MHQGTDRVDEPFRGLLLRYRGRTSLTQGLLATGTGVHLRSIQAWEAGASFPRSERLQALIACLFGAGGFAVGREAVESAALWSAVDRESPRPLPPFDSRWFANLAAARVQRTVPEPLVL